jgi:hypothetical protein
MLLWFQLWTRPNPIKDVPDTAIKADHYLKSAQAASRNRPRARRSYHAVRAKIRWLFTVSVRIGG